MGEQWDYRSERWHYQEESDAYTHIVRTQSGGFVCQFPQLDGRKVETRARLASQAPQLRDENAELRNWAIDVIDVLTELCASGVDSPIAERLVKRGIALLTDTGEVSHD